jgi:hypothetical protein
MERDLIEQLAVVAECVPAEHVEVGSDAALELGDGRVLERDHEDLRQRECDAPAQLVLAGRGLRPERIHHMVVGGTLAGGEARAHGVDSPIRSTGSKKLSSRAGFVEGAQQSIQHD